MPSKGDTTVNTFVGGLITEASPLSFPTNTSFDEINMKLLREGSRERRLGLDYEDGGVLHDTGFTTEQLQTFRQRFFRWPTPSGSNKVEIGVIQIGNNLFFIDLFTTSPSANLLNGGSAVNSTLTVNTVLDFAIYNNDLIVVAEGLESPFILKYNETTDTVSLATGRILIRDLYGIDDSLDTKERPIELSLSHEYNLRNQGWDANITSTCGAGITAIQCTFDELAVYPSNSDIWTLGQVEDTTDPDLDKYDPNKLDKRSFDIGRAARGHFIIDLYTRGASRATESELGELNLDQELGKITTLASYAGRLFYSGIRSRVSFSDKFSPKLSGSILFSQVGVTDDELVKCYQQSDPTSNTDSDVVPTDGGIIQIVEAVNIVKLLPVKNSLFVFAENGIWEIKGNDAGFTATEFQVDKVSSIAVISRDSIVEANGTIVFWAKEGIFSLKPDQFGVGFDSTNLTIRTIQRFYNSLPNLVKEGARAYYDVSQNRIRWLFQSDDPDIIGNPLDILPASPSVPLVGEVSAVETLSDNINPMVARLSDTTLLIIYRRFSGSALKGKITTINSDLTLSYGTERDLGIAAPNGGHTITYVSDNKILLIAPTTANQLEARILNITGDVISLGAVKVLNSETIPSSNDPNRVSLIDTTKGIVSLKSNVGGIPALQVLEISPSDVITNGTVSKNANMAGAIHTDVVALSPTSGVMISAGTRVFTEHFSVSGITITFNGTLYSFLTGSQISGSFTYDWGSVRKINNNKCMIYGLVTNPSLGYTEAPTNFTLTETSGVLTGGDILVDTTHTAINLTSYRLGVFSVALDREFISGSSYIPSIASNSIQDPSTNHLRLGFGTHTIVGFPEGGAITSNLLVVAWEGTATGLVIEAGVLRI